MYSPTSLFILFPLTDAKVRPSALRGCRCSLRLRGLRRRLFLRIRGGRAAVRGGGRALRAALAQAVGEQVVEGLGVRLALGDLDVPRHGRGEGRCLAGLEAPDDL